MKLLDKQLQASLRGDFKQGLKLCSEMQDEIVSTRSELYLNTQESFIRFKQLEERGLNHIRADYNRGWYEMMNGDLFEGFRLMNRGRQAGLWGNKYIGTDKPIWDGKTDIKDKYILFVCEAGLGDQILFIRFVEDLHMLGAKVIVACEDYGLGSVFARMEEVSAVVRYSQCLSVYHDYWLPSMAAPVALSMRYNDLRGESYLTAHPEYVKKFNKLIYSDKLKVGIRWLSMPKEGVCNTLGDAYLSRKFPADLMFEAVIQDPVQLYSLQRDEGADQCPRMSGVVDLGPELQNWEDTAGAIENLDLVISSCTSVAHLAAAMGKPTWIVVPLMAYFSWSLPGSSSPWYDSVKLFRQEMYGSWQHPFDKIRKELNAYTT